MSRRTGVPGNEHDITKPFARAEGLKAGIGERVLDGKRFHRLFRSVRLGVGTAVDEAMMARAALVLAPEAVVSHSTAARIWGGVVPDDPDVHLTVRTRRDRPRHAGIQAHHTSMGPASRRRAGILLTTPERTLVDLARRLSLIDLVVLADSLIKAAVTTPERLVAECDAWRGPGARRARAAARLARRGVESPQETRLRLLLVLAGLPEPKINPVVKVPKGAATYRLDLAYEAEKVGVEYEGRQHAEDPVQWRRDMRRREDFDRLGWRLVLVESEGIFRTPGETIERVTLALRERGAALPRPAAPIAWQRHFPGGH